MAQKKAGGSTKNGRDSSSKRLGIKIFHNNFVKKGSIIIKQNGTKYLVGNNVFISKNYTIQSKINGLIFFKKKKKKTYVSVKNVY
ncbi:ribosomal protein L27 [Candidatus Carsonella ruddii PV]|uniref:Large ribosomal subunit protein bL27 n=1 Tax=Carsonella ruddii (strain PV) TaxID=387662 RepID=Q05FK8_CARRP|nr:50S ribosomal protein L27 [Candidatus Carsonella ruddii]BAF35163.1 ribosomal protein L27 [Candidatus Carsonella ruddii PV]